MQKKYYIFRITEQFQNWTRLDFFESKVINDCIKEQILRNIIVDADDSKSTGTVLGHGRTQVGFNPLEFEKLLTAAQKFQKTFSALFGELTASSHVTEIKHYRSLHLFWRKIK